MISSAKKEVQITVAQCVAMGMKHVVVSPGSRNAPMIIALNQHPEIETIVIPDERSAAFYALGMAQQLNAPVGILCTSGSAALNYYPAIAEAFYQLVPLIVFTADRPKSWVNQGDGQTIDQDNVFKNHIRYSITIPESTAENFEWVLSRELSTAFHHANGNVKGPVHINLPFSEPLYQQAEATVTETDFKIIEVLETVNTLSNSQKQQLEKIWNQSDKKMIICGQLNPDIALLAELKALAADPSVAILVENTSNLVDYGFIHCIDRTLNSIQKDEIAAFAPDLLITIGGAVVSKRIKTFLRHANIAHHWKIGFDFLFMDTYQSMTQSIQVKPSAFMHEVTHFKRESDSTFGARWKQKDFLIQEKAQNFFEQNTTYGDLNVFHTVLDYIPETSHLHMANSSVVRYCQLFDPIRSIQYWCNRGTSGIDGSTSTVAGAALIKKETWHTLITGDISFFYDSNALWNKVLPPNLRIFMINNAGGGIFKIIPGPNSTAELDDFFVFKHDFSAEHICKGFKVDYFKAENIESIENQMEDFYTFEEDGRAKLMEIFTPSEMNHEQLDVFFEEIRLFPQSLTPTE
jgi:2-succinyl-5-enolpyruvyl-6-hydroxy-3-cyclohexene-1-carboxylate synthase